MHDISSSSPPPSAQKFDSHSSETHVATVVAAPLGSRPPSPANEAGEDGSDSTTPIGTVDEVLISADERMRIDAAQSRRKSSAWKGFNLKRRLSKVNLIKLPFGDGTTTTGTCTKVRSTSMFHHAPTDGIRLSPVEISPSSIESATGDSTPNTPTGTDDLSSGGDAKSDYLTELESNIVQSLSDLDKTPSSDDRRNNDSSSNTASNSDQESEPVGAMASAEYGQSMPPRSILLHHSGAASTSDDPLEYRRRTQRQLSQPQSLLQQAKRVDFSEETIVKSLGTQLEGAHISRPADLPLFDDYGNPIAPPRSMTKVKRNRMLSVPNLKLSRLDAVKLRDLRANKTSQKDQGSSSSFAGSLIRRFSKY